MEYSCYICKKNVSNTVKGLGSHFKRVHNLQLTNYSSATREFICAQEQCQQSYFLFSSLSRHLKKHHNTNHVSSEISVENLSTLMLVDQHADQSAKLLNKKDIVDEKIAEEDDGLSKGSCEETVGNFYQNISVMKSDIAKNVLEFQAKSNVTFTVTDAAVKACSSVAKSVADTMKSEILAFLKQENFDTNGSACSDLMQKFETLSRPFEDLKTQNQRLAFYKKSFEFIEPKEICLGSREEQIYNQLLNKYETKFVPDTFQYVPIIDTLSSTLKHPEVLNFIQNKEKDCDGYINNYSSAKQYNNHPFFKKFPDAIQLQLYYDEVEVCNPLGSKTKIHEVATFYFTILNIPSKFNSTLTNIHLLAMCNSQDLKKYGFTKVLQPFLEDLRSLEADEGVKINIHGRPYTLRATIACVCADGLAAHALFGFLSPSAKYFCRLCLATRERIQSEFRASQFQSRGRSNYEEQVEASETSLDACRNSGVKERCALNSSLYFHCTENFCFDAMHDLLEGICGMEIKLLLNHWMHVDVVNGLNTDVLNRRLKSFKYGFSERKNKPSPNFTKQMIINIKDHKIKQKAAQTWCLMRVLPFILNDLILPTDKHFHLIHLLSRIMQIIFSPVVTQGLACYLESLIIDHHEEFKELFPDINLINKHHHLIHYPDCLVNFGPLVKMWCMRYEAKHNFFKRRASVNCNFKNITKSLAVSHQLAQCSTWSVNNPFTAPTFKTSVESVWLASCLSHNYLKALGYEDNVQVQVSKAFIYHGIEYRNGSFIVLKTTTDDEQSFPLFCQIKEIILLDANIYFFVRIWTTTHLNPFLNAYCIRWFDHNELKLIKPEELPDYHTYSTWSPFGSHELIWM